jgi:hypothetical protein
MAASNSTPIQLYYSNTPGTAPANTNLIIGELAINVPDGIIYYLDSTNSVNVIARTSAAAGQFANVTFGDGSKQYTAGASWNYVNAVNAMVQTAITDITYLQGVNNQQNTVISNTQTYANGAYIRANAGFDFANSVYSNYAYPAYVSTQNQGGVDAQQNTNIGLAGSYANGAFTKSNTNATAITALQGVDLTQNTNTTLVGNYANAAFVQANTNASDIVALQGVNVTQNARISAANTLAWAAFDYANTIIATGGSIDGVARFTANAAFDEANTNSLAITALQSVNITQNTTIQSAFDKANTNATLITNLQGVDAGQNTFITNVGVFANGAFAKSNTNALAITDLQNVNLTQNTTVQASFDKANTNALAITALQGVDAGQNTAITNVGVYANGAFVTANNAVANTTNITVANNITIPGQANVYHRLSVGTGSYQVLPNLIAQFTGTSDTYSQINQQNLSGKGTGDVVITADNGTDSVNYADMGMAGSIYDNTSPNAFPMVQPNDGYFMVVGNPGQNYGGNVYFGTSGSGSYGDIVFIQGNNYDQIARFKNGANVEFYRPMVANSFTTKDGIDVVTYTNTANTYLKGLIDTKVNKTGDTINGTLTINNTASANALVVTGNVVISQDLRVSGNLFIGGNSTSISSNNLTLQDSLIYVANSNPTNVVDIGIVGSFTSDKYQHTGLVRDAHDGIWKLFSNVVAEPTSTIDFDNAVYDSIKVGGIESPSATIYGINVIPYINAAFSTANTAWTTANNKVATVSGTSGRISSTGTTDITIDLATTGVTGGTYTFPSLQVDSYGRIITISNQTPVTKFNNRSGNVALTSGDVTVALGYTPVDSSVYTTGLSTQSDIDSTQNTNISLTGSYANSAYTKANNTGVYANGAYVRANSGFGVANNALNTAISAFDGANTNASLIVSLTDEVTSSFDTANLGLSYASSGYLKANNVGNYANGAFARANSGFGVANNAAIFANGAYQLSNTNSSSITLLSDELTIAYDTTNSAYGQANTGTILANSAFAKANNSGIFANGAFTKANTVGVTAGAAFDTANLVGIFANAAFDMANTAYTVGGGAGAFANGAFATANAAFVQANNALSYATNAGNYANGSFVTANNALTTATNSGVYANGAFTQANAAFDAANTAYSLGGVLVGTYANGAFVQANSAFGKANSAYTLADSSFAKANSAYDASVTNATNITNVGIYANGAYTRANTAGSFANSAFGLANTANTLAVSSFDLGNTTYALVVPAFNTANNSGVYANGAYTQANSALTYANNAGTFANGAFAFANTVYSNYAYPAYANTLDLASVNLKQNTDITLTGSYANGAFTQANAAFGKANNVGNYANGAFDRANAGFDVANSATISAVAAFSAANNNAAAITTLQSVDAGQNTVIGIVFNVANAAFDAANTGTVAVAAYTRANAAFSAANTNASNITVIQGVDSWQNTYIQTVDSNATSAFGQANAAYVLANSAYAYANTLVTGGTSIDGWARGQANAAFNTANASFNATNTSISLATSAFAKANSIVAPTYYTGTTPPSNPSTSAIWYKTDTDVMYEWITSDGTNYYWIDIDSPTVSVGNTTISYTYTGYGRAAAMAMVFGGF